MSLNFESCNISALKLIFLFIINFSNANLKINFIYIKYYLNSDFNFCKFLNIKNYVFVIKF